MRGSGAAGRRGRAGARSPSPTRNGPLKVALGNAGDERVTFVGNAFTRETNNAEGAQKAKDVLAKMADPAFAAGDNVDLTAPGGGVDGYDLTVWISPRISMPRSPSSTTTVRPRSTAPMGRRAPPSLRTRSSPPTCGAPSTCTRRWGTSRPAACPAAPGNVIRDRVRGHRRATSVRPTSPSRPSPNPAR